MVRFRVSEQQVAREVRSAERSEAAHRVWRRTIRNVIAWCFGAQAAATAVGAAGFLVDDPALGRFLLGAGQVGVIVLPLTIAVLWTVEAHRRGDI
ncbi:MAG: hypothetical protein KF785_02125 [Gemmatimonadales bacterium]|nr:hypothetical protein [Gemmatimonadales bacterium]